MKQFPKNTREAVAMAIEAAREDVRQGRYREAGQSLDLAFQWLGVAREEIRQKLRRVGVATTAPIRPVESQTEMVQ